MSSNGSVAMTEIWYGHSGDHVELVISRYPDRQTLDTRWKELSATFDANAAAPKVGESAGWLEIGAGPRRQLVFRQGLFTGWAECTVGLSSEPLMELITVTVARMARAAEPDAASNVAVPHR